jgi:hypothetical protein
MEDCMLSRFASAVFGIYLTLLLGTPDLAAALSREERVIAGSPGDSLEVRHLILTGSNEEIGRELARLASERYQAKPARSQDELRARAQRHYIEKNFPILFARMSGVAAFYGQRLDDDAWDHSGLAFIELHAGCSIVHLPRQLTSIGSSVVSRDYDYSTGSISFGFLSPGMLHATARPYLMELHPDTGYASIAMVAYDLLSGVIDGMNSEGLIVTMALDDDIFSKGHPDPTLSPSPGLGELQVMRLLLDTCATADEAKEALLGIKQYYEFVPVHYLIADRFGRSFIWEYSEAHNKEFIIENPGRPLVMTNFSVNRHLDQDKPPSAEQARSVCKRYSLLTEQLSTGGLLSEDFIRQTHKKVDAELAPDADSSRPPIRTFWHALYYPEQRRAKFSFYLHDGPAVGVSNRVNVVRSPYLEFHLAPTEHGKPPVASPASAEPPRKVTKPASNAAPSPAIAGLRDGGATVSVLGDGVSVNLDKVTDLAPLLRRLREIPELTELTIQNPKLDDAGIASLQGLPRLAALDLYGSSIGDDGMRVLKTLPGLRILEMRGTRVTDAGLAYLGELTRLEQLGLRGTHITDAGLARLETLTSLTSLNLSETGLTDAGLVHLQPMTRLELLSLANDPITDAGLAHLSRVKTITGLFLPGTRVTDAGLIHLKPMGHLTKLNLSKTPVTDAGVAEARKFLPFWCKIQR